MSVGSVAKKSSSLQIQDTRFIPSAVLTTDREHEAESEVPGLASVEPASGPTLNPDDPKIIVDYSAFAECLRLCLLYDAEETQENSRPSDSARSAFGADGDHLRTANTNTLEEACV